MSEAILGSIRAIAFILIIGFTFRGPYAMFKAATHRKPGYKFLSVFNVESMLFRDAAFTDEGLKWCTTFQYCLLGWNLAFVTCCLAS